MLRRVKPKNVSLFYSIRCSHCGKELRGQTKKVVVNRADLDEWRYSDIEGNCICGECRLKGHLDSKNPPRGGSGVR